jgi:hypothetical protein
MPQMITSRTCMVLLRRAAAALLVVLMAAVVGCGTASVPCGAFTFTGTPLPVGGSPNRGINNSVAFNFNAAACGAPACNCGEICYIQIVRIIDWDTGDYLQPFSEQSDRMVTGNATTAFNGWAVDRLFGRKWGYYGRFDDGTFAGSLTPGSSTTTATLRDTPSGWPDHSWFDAVSTTVCIDSGAACNNELMGYEYWLFTVGTGGVVGDPFSEIGRTWHQDAFDLAVVEWNADAPGLAKHSFPAMTRMP